MIAIHLTYWSGVKIYSTIQAPLGSVVREHSTRSYGGVRFVPKTRDPQLRQAEAAGAS